MWSQGRQKLPCNAGVHTLSHVLCSLRIWQGPHPPTHWPVDCVHGVGCSCEMTGKKRGKSYSQFTEILPYPCVNDIANTCTIGSLLRKWYKYTFFSWHIGSYYCGCLNLTVSFLVCSSLKSFIHHILRQWHPWVSLLLFLKVHQLSSYTKYTLIGWCSLRITPTSHCGGNLFTEVHSILGLWIGLAILLPEDLAACLYFSTTTSAWPDRVHSALSEDGCYLSKAW